jgi:predicted transcriptional regulator
MTLSIYDLPDRQRHIFLTLYNYIEENGQSPTLQELEQLSGMNRSTMITHLRDLEFKGYLGRRQVASRAFYITPEVEQIA